MAAVEGLTKIPELRRRILFTIGMLAVYRVGCNIPVPGINTDTLARFFEGNQNTLFGMMNMFSGRALERASIFALGIMPYISASIIFQLLTVVWPYLNSLSKEGEIGRKKINQYTRYATVILALFQGYGIARALMSAENAGFVLFRDSDLSSLAFLHSLLVPRLSCGLGNRSLSAAWATEFHSSSLLASRPAFRLPASRQYKW